MIYTPTRSELAEFGLLLNVPTIPPEPFLSALIDIYTDFCDMDYNEIVCDIKAEYLTYHSEKPLDLMKTASEFDSELEFNCSDSKYGYLWYDDGGYVKLVAVD